MTPLSAKNCKVRAAGATYACREWSVEPSADIVDSTHSESAGFHVGTPCVKKATVTIDADYDAAQNPHESPVGFVAGATLTNVRLYLSGTSGPYWYFPSLNIASTPHKANVKDTHRLSVRGEGTGTFSEPSGNVS